MKIPGLTTESILGLHALITEALAADDATAGLKPYGVREHSDWRVQADAFETELRNREVKFDKIEW